MTSPLGFTEIACRLSMVLRFKWMMGVLVVDFFSQAAFLFS